MSFSNTKKMPLFSVSRIRFPLPRCWLPNPSSTLARFHPTPRAGNPWKGWRPLRKSRGTRLWLTPTDSRQHQTTKTNSRSRQGSRMTAAVRQLWVLSKAATALTVKASLLSLTAFRPPGRRQNSKSCSKFLRHQSWTQSQNQGKK